MSETKPSKVEPGQVWCYEPWGPKRPLVVTSNEGGWLRFDVPNTSQYEKEILLSEHWFCIGIETPSGRVTVGEKRVVPEGGAWRVTAVRDNGIVDIVADHGARTCSVAEDVARWSLAPNPGPALAAAASQAVKSPAPSIYEATVRECDRQISRALLGPRHNEQGPGIAALTLPPARVAVQMPEPLPERWARWGLP